MVVIATFGLIAVAALASGVYWLIILGRRAAQASRTRGVGASQTQVSGRDDADDDDEDADDSDDDSSESERRSSRRGGLAARFAIFRRHARQARRDMDFDDDDDELPPQVATLLSATPLDSVIVDAEGEVLRSSPVAYQMGIVANDAISDVRVSDALANVFRGKGKQRFELVTHTPVEYVDDTIARTAAEDEGDDNNADDAGSGRSSAVGLVGSVTRRNWLNITVARLDENQAVILIEDVSEQRRFARIRDAFVNNVTEQLLKPTRALENLGKELESEHLDQHQVSEYAQQVRAFSGDLNHLVSDLLLLLKAQEPITANTANRVDMKPLVERVIARHTPLATHRGIQLRARIPEGMIVNGQVDQLEGAISKLLDNAVEYSSDGSSVGIVVSRVTNADGSVHEDADSRSNTIVVRVVDHGIGISSRDQPHIFERFWRGSHQEQRQEHASQGESDSGTGLGLAIVKHVALTHHGAVSVWSAPGEGSTFSLTLPAAQNE